MSNTQIRLRHFAFFEALAGAPDESSEEWRTAKAGLLTLRMYDNWADFGARVITTNEWGVRAVRRTITMIRKGNPLRTLILAVLDGMRKAPDAEAISLAAPLMAYARALEFEARWALAADVYSTVGERASYSGQTRLSISLYMSRGACLRTLARWSEATMMYKQAAWLAEHLGDTENVLRSRVAMANVSMDRGNLPKAEKILDQVIDQAQSVELRGVRANALHARGNAANRRGDFERAISFCYEAIDGLENQEARDRALADVAASFSDLGLREAARDAYLILAVTSQAQFTRWVAELNLMEIAARDREEGAFEQYRRELAKAELPAKLAAHYHYLAGQCYRTFGKERLARAALERAVRIASDSEINEVLLKAEASLRDFAGGEGVAKTAVAAKPSKQTAQVAEAIHQMRLVVNSAG